MDDPPQSLQWMLHRGLRIVFLGPPGDGQAAEQAFRYLHSVSAGGPRNRE
jgi:hypothetical protein